jgi:hypothetical protein
MRSEVDVSKALGQAGTKLLWICGLFGMSPKALCLKGAYEGSRMFMIPKRKNAIESPTAPRSLSDVVPLVTCS